MKSLFGSGIMAALFSVTMSVAQPFGGAANPIIPLQLLVSSTDKSYAVYIETSVMSGCPYLRYRVAGVGFSVTSKALRPGQSQMLSLGDGFAPGLHDLQLQAVGCGSLLSQQRMVVLRKASPDHGWRALAALARTKQPLTDDGRFRPDPVVSILR